MTGSIALSGADLYGAQLEEVNLDGVMPEEVGLHQASISCPHTPAAVLENSRLFQAGMWG